MLAGTEKLIITTISVEHKKELLQFFNMVSHKRLYDKHLV